MIMMMNKIEIFILNEYDDLNDMCKPRRMIYYWEKHKITPFELYDILNNIKGKLYIKI